MGRPVKGEDTELINLFQKILATSAIKSYNILGRKKTKVISTARSKTENLRASSAAAKYFQWQYAEQFQTQILYHSEFAGFYIHSEMHKRKGNRNWIASGETNAQKAKENQVHKLQ